MNQSRGARGSNARDRRAGQVDRDQRVYDKRRRQQQRRRAELERRDFDPAPVTSDEWVVGEEEGDGLRRMGPPTAVSDALAAFIEARGWSDRLQGATLWVRWHDIVGPDLAEHCEPVRLAGGVLVLRAENPMWATQLRYLSGQLLQNAERVLGPGHVRQIRTVTGPLERQEGS